jgi:hypothetical protein
MVRLTVIVKDVLAAVLVLENGPGGAVHEAAVADG